VFLQGSNQISHLLVLQNNCSWTTRYYQERDSNQKIYPTEDKANCPIVIVVGTSLSITPNQEYFEVPVTSYTVTQLNGLASQTPVKGIGQLK